MAPDEPMDDCNCQSEAELDVYVGTKIIKAKPMSRDEADKLLNKDIQPSENIPGYLVIYPDGYKSWSPQYVFEAAYRRISNKEKALIT